MQIHFTFLSFHFTYLSFHFTDSEADAILAQLKAGAVFSAGCRHPLLRVEEEELVFVTPLPPTPPTKEAATVAYVQQARSRIARAHPPVLGTGLTPLPPPPSAAAELRMPLKDAGAWLTSAGWEAVPEMDEAMAAMAASGGLAANATFASALRASFLAQRIDDSAYSSYSMA